MKIKTRIVIALVLIAVLLALILIRIYGIKLYLRPERIANTILTALEESTSSKAIVGKVKIDPERGIKLLDVKITIPDNTLPDDFKDLVEIHKIDLRIRRRFLGIGFSLDKIELEGVKVNCIYSRRLGKWNWQYITKGKKDKSQKPFKLPDIKKFSIEGLLLYIGDENSNRLTRLDLEAKKEKDNYSGKYRIRFTLKDPAVEKEGQRKETKTSIIRGMILYNPANNSIITGNVELGPIEKLSSILPEQTYKRIKRFIPEGKINIDDINYVDKRYRISITAENLTFLLPFVSGRPSFKDAMPLDSYLITLSNLTGKIILTPDGINLKNLKGLYKNSNSPIFISGSVKKDNNFKLHITAEGFMCPAYEDPIAIRHLPDKFVSFLKNFKPKGKADLDINIARKIKEGITLDGKIKIVKGSCEYINFPYRVDNIYGRILVLNNAFYINKLTGVSEGGVIQLTGYLSEPSKTAEANLVIYAKSTPLSQKLYNALPARYKRLWNQFSIQGRADATILLTKPKGKNNWKNKMNIIIKGARGWYRSFPYPLEDVYTIIDIDQDSAYVREFKARQGTAEVEIKAEILNLDSTRPQVRLDIKAEGLPIDDNLLNALPEDAKKLILECSLKGKTNINGYIKYEEGRVSYKLVSSFDNMQFKYKKFPYKLLINGRITILPNKVTIDSIFWEDKGSLIQADGTLYLKENKKHINLNIEAKKINLSSSLYEALPKELKKLWDRLDPKGRIDADIRLSAKDEDNLNIGKEANTEAVIEDLVIKILPENCSISYKNLVHIEDINGRLVYQRKGKRASILLEDLTGKMGLQPIDINGRIEIEGDKRIGILACKAKNIAVNKELIEHISQALIPRQNTKNITIKAIRELSLELDKVSFNMDRTQSRWDLKGRISLVGIEIEDILEEPTDIDFKGNLSWQVTKEASSFPTDTTDTTDTTDAITAETINSIRSTEPIAPTNPVVSIDGEIRINKLKIQSLGEIEKLSITVKKASKEDFLRIERLTGRYCDGEFTGKGELEFAGDKILYALRAILKDISAGKAFREDKIKGTLTGEIFFKGTLTSKYPETGGGRIEISEAEAMKFPLFTDIYSKVYKTTPALTEFHNITIDFELERHIARAYKIVMIGPSLSMIGSGRINLSNKHIQLRFVILPPEFIKKTPIIKDIIIGTSSELILIEAKGPKDQPTIEAKHLFNITGTIEEFLEGK